MHRLQAMFPHAAGVLNTIGADALLGGQYRGLGSIFILHSVVPDRRDYLLDPLRTSAAFLDATLSHYVAAGIDILSLDGALERLSSPTPKPFVCFTLDDGYRDNRTVALPIFERHRAPFTVFVTTCFVNRTANNWWFALAEVIKQRAHIDVEALGRDFETSSFEDKVSVYRLLCSAVARGAISEQDVSVLVQRYGVDLEALLDREALSESEIKALSAHPLVTIGAHTESHRSLAQLPIEEARRDMRSNKLWLEEITSRAVNHFAYPYGGRENCGEREFALAQELGFRTGLTTRVANLSRDHLARPTALPRLRCFSEHEDIRLLEFQRSGAANALGNLFGGAFAVT